MPAHRKVFEPFGGIRSAFTAAKDGRPVDSQIEMASSEGLYTSDPDYAPPCVGDIELVFVAFDMLFVDQEVRRDLGIVLHCTDALIFCYWSCAVLLHALPTLPYNGTGTLPVQLTVFCVHLQMANEHFCLYNLSP